MEWEIVLLAGRASRHGIPSLAPPKLDLLKYSVTYSATYADRWKSHPLKVIGILLPSPMTTADTPVSVSASTRMIPWRFLKPGRLGQRKKPENLSRFSAPMEAENTFH